MLQTLMLQMLATPCGAQTMLGAAAWPPPQPDPLAALANIMPAAASGAAPGAAPARLCGAAIVAAEAQTHIPEAFLAAIGRVESGNGPAGDAAWPWTINAGGSGHYYMTKAEALAAARGFIAAGQRSLDVGCLQVNLQFHPDAFTSLEEAFDPAANANFAAKYLLSLFHQTGSWPQAAAAYHSFTPALGRAYQQKVLAAWASPDPRLPFRARDGAPPDPALPVAAPGPAPPGAAVSASMPGAAPPPVEGFSRVIRQDGPMAPRGAIGRSLASYRAMPVRPATRSPLKK